jgi:hypothetical protein
MLITASPSETSLRNRHYRSLWLDFTPTKKICRFIYHIYLHFTNIKKIDRNLELMKCSKIMMNYPCTPVSGKLVFTIPNNSYNEDPQGFEYKLDTFKSYYLVTGQLGRIDGSYVTDFKANVKLGKSSRYKKQGVLTTVYSWALLEFDGNFVVYTPGSVDIYCFEPEWAFAKIEEIYAKYKEEDKKEEASFQMIRAHGGGSYSSEEVKLKRSYPKNDEELVLHYGEDFIPYRDEFFRYFKETKSGIHILLGDPGVGKTSFIRYAIGQAEENHKFYFIPPQFYGDLGSTQLLDFLRSEQENQDPTEDDGKLFLILEDSEKLLLPRSDGNSFSVSELLNISDGLLGEGLDMHFICTINCKLDKLDAAVIRPGRLLTSKTFDPLSYELALKLADYLKKPLLDTDKAYTLAEIYHAKANNPTTKVRLGF